jgi:hypothetical protein
LPVNRRSPKGVPIYGKSVIRCLRPFSRIKLELRPARFNGDVRFSNRCCELLVLRCGWCGLKLSAAEKLDAGGKPDAAVWRNCGCCGTADAAKLRCCGDRWLWRLAGIRSTSRADSVLAGPTARSCDLRTSKQRAATGRSIWEAKVSGAQCLWGVWFETWRENAHGRQPKGALGEWAQLAGGA